MKCICRAMTLAGPVASPGLHLPPVGEGGHGAGCPLTQQMQPQPGRISGLTRAGSPCWVPGTRRDQASLPPAHLGVCTTCSGHPRPRGVIGSGSLWRPVPHRPLPGAGEGGEGYGKGTHPRHASPRATSADSAQPSSLSPCPGACTHWGLGLRS